VCPNSHTGRGCRGGVSDVWFLTAYPDPNTLSRGCCGGVRGYRLGHVLHNSHTSEGEGWCVCVFVCLHGRMLIRNDVSVKYVPLLHTLTRTQAHTSMTDTHKGTHTHMRTD